MTQNKERVGNHSFFMSKNIFSDIYEKKDH